MIDRETGNEWRKLGIDFANNNGIDWFGNSYILTFEYDDDMINELEEKLPEHGINLYEHSLIGQGFHTHCFGFNDYMDITDDYYEMDRAALKLCANIMSELKIYWFGWPDAPAFTLFATEEQIWELSERLKEPIAEWQHENGYHPRE